MRSTTSRTTRIAAVVAAAVLAACGAGDELGAPDPTPAGSPQVVSPSPEAASEAAPSPRLVPVPEAEREAADGQPVEPDRFDSADELAEQLLAAETAIRDEATPADELPAWAWTQQQAYRDLAVTEEWVDPVRAAMPDELHDAFDANLRATARLREMTQARDDLPGWRIVEPPPADVLLDAYQEAADEYGIAWEYLASINLVETRMGRIDGVSVAGAMGPMQFMPSTWDHWGEGDVNDPHDAIAAAARYLVDHGAPDDMQSAIFAYNHSQNYVDAIGLHAEVMMEDPLAFRGYYHWRVYYRLSGGDVVLPVGYDGAD